MFRIHYISAATLTYLDLSAMHNWEYSEEAVTTDWKYCTFKLYFYIKISSHVQ